MSKCREPDNPERFHLMDQAAQEAVKLYGRFGMTRELALVAMQTWNHVLNNELHYGDMQAVEKVVFYNEKFYESVSVFDEDHKILK